MIKNVCIKKTKGKGMGVFALKNFKKREPILFFKKGRVIKKNDMNKISKEDKKHLNEIRKGTYEIQRPPERFINHSCNPNSIRKEELLVALKHIRKGEEITVDYRINAYDNWKMRCKCGSKNCAGIVIGNFFTLPKKLQEKYLPYTLKFIKEEFKKRHGL